MAVEPRRGCGFRKVGGLYLVSDGRGVACDRLPILLEVCPTCGHGIKQALGWTWVDPAKLIDGVHPQCQDDFPCPLCMAPEQLGQRAGLLWIGERFYKTPQEFEAEAQALGISRRISAPPRGFKIGETWVLLAHPKAVETWVPVDEGSDSLLQTVLALGKKKLVMEPGIFHVWRPHRLEQIVPESWCGTKQLGELIDRGITPVFVPDDDPDHRGTAYDKPVPAADDYSEGANLGE